MYLHTCALDGLIKIDCKIKSVFCLSFWPQRFVFLEEMIISGSNKIMHQKLPVIQVFLVKLIKKIYHNDGWLKIICAKYTDCEKSVFSVCMGWGDWSRTEMVTRSGFMCAQACKGPGFCRLEGILFSAWTGSVQWLWSLGLQLLTG